MQRILFSAVVALLFCGGSLNAAEIKGKLKSVDADKKLVTITVDDKEQQLAVQEDARIVVHDVRSYLSEKGLKDPAFKAGYQIVVKTAKKGDREVVTDIQIFTGRKG